MNQQPPEVRSDLSAQQRGLEVYSALRDGPKRVHDLAAILGITERGVYRILENISYKYPVTNAGGYWYLLSTEEQRQAHHILHTLRRELESAQPAQAFAHAMKIADIVRLVAILERIACVPEPD